MRNNLSDIDIHADVAAEVDRQISLWGFQSRPDGTGLPYQRDAANAIKGVAGRMPDEYITWRLVLLEEVYEAFAETDPAPLIEELTQVAAVCVSWIRDIKSREA